MIAFLQIQRILQRTTIRLEMHNSARFLQQSLSEQVGAMQQDGALWVETKADSGAGDGQVSLTFLKGKTDEHDFTTTNTGEPRRTASRTASISEPLLRSRLVQPGSGIQQAGWRSSSPGPPRLPTSSRIHHLVARTRTA